MSHPPSTGPRIGATTMPRPQKPMALPRSCGGKASSSTACESGCIAPPVAPCSRRNATSSGRFGARPQSSDEIVNPATDVISSRLRPKWLASQPVSGSTIALATRYDVSTHVDSSIVADRLPAMCGSDTLTTVVSSTSMKVANMTAIATIHGLTWRWLFRGRPFAISCRWSARPTCRAAGDGRDPGPASSTIFTGTRCTTLT